MRLIWLCFLIALSVADAIKESPLPQLFFTVSEAVCQFNVVKHLQGSCQFLDNAIKVQVTKFKYDCLIIKFIVDLLNCRLISQGSNVLDCEGKDALECAQSLHGVQWEMFQKLHHSHQDYCELFNSLKLAISEKCKTELDSGHSNSEALMLT